jgi:hypothetical protein
VAGPKKVDHEPVLANVGQWHARIDPANRANYRAEHMMVPATANLAFSKAPTTAGYRNLQPDSQDHQHQQHVSNKFKQQPALLQQSTLPPLKA